ncbi:oxidoreductase FAD/NAD(P)-binding domain protein [Fibrella aestuarina BUZ 2]|uniref:Oxidoreductase FAD/NAD(P)-binding domain protein n=1 Tax=Fibrella aestuarina BUZ 2 TaxID=1166018 RepID=I0K3C4_9BACT|nr:ferredoxin--NADP reductase [Fibrella aestuarina]CCG98627.1 oxidoreductase FAD/NAD(P)-binding domain protein [Fibrella aestuarina BUZ 2]
MASRYYLKVKDVVQETSDAITVNFWHPISEEVRYQPGQFLTFLLTIGNEKIRRSYSMSSSPHVDAALSVTVKRLPGGLASNYLCDRLKPGDVIETLEPMGTFTPKLNPGARRLHILIGAGSGITPLFSMVKSILHVEPNSEVWLIYGNRNESSIIYKAHLDAMASVHASRLTVTHVLSQPAANWSGFTGRINKSNLLKLLETHRPEALRQAEYYLCGPDGLMAETVSALNLLAVPADHIHKESFQTASTAQAVGVVLEGDTDDADSSTQDVTVLYEGNEYKFTVEPHQTILEAALDLDIDLPYSCQAGMCTACLGKCVSGEVKLDEEDGLSESELKAGYVLTCVAHPASRNVVIEIE